jgi:uncharacterized Zn finger protein
MSVSLKKLLNEQELYKLAGYRTFERGQHYAANGRVVSLAELENQVITAQVQGSQLYEVRLWLKGKNLQYSCTCLFAVQGAFCKHCVAVSLIFTYGMG